LTEEEKQAEKNQRTMEKKFETKQRAWLHGFTSRELADLDAISSRKLKASTLSGPILDVLQCWETDEDVLIEVDVKGSRSGLYGFNMLTHQPENTSGYWEMGNEIVAKALKPTLQVATYMLTNMYMLPWVSELYLERKLMSIILTHQVV
jgi:hypothetical protein